MGVSGSAQIFWVHPIISGTGKATDFKFCWNIHRVDPNKSSWKMLGIVTVGVVRDSRKISGHPCRPIGRIARSSLRLHSFLVYVRLNFTTYILTDFQNYFTVRTGRKFVIILLLKIPPHLKCVATLPCENVSVIKATTENKTTSATTHFKKLTSGNNVFIVSVIV